LVEGEARGLDEGGLACVARFSNVSFLYERLSIGRRGYYTFLLKVSGAGQEPVDVKMVVTLYGLERDLVYMGVAILLAGVILKAFSRISLGKQGRV